MRLAGLFRHTDVEGDFADVGEAELEIDRVAGRGGLEDADAVAEGADLAEGFGGDMGGEAPAALIGDGRNGVDSGDAVVEGGERGADHAAGFSNGEELSWGIGGRACPGGVGGEDRADCAGEFIAG